MRARRSGTTAATCCSRVEVSLLPLWEKVADEVRRMRGLYRRRQTPHPSRCRFASIADAKHRRPFLSTAADGRLCHPLPQGERGAPSACRAHFLTSPSPPPPSRSASPAPPNTSPGETVATDP